jgi:uncharacterized protein (DUF1697 family)
MTSIALLRGINVGGKNTVRMAELVSLLQSLHFANVSSYLQSGNFVFDHNRAGPSALSDGIEQAISQKFGFDVKVIVRTAEELRSLILGNPLLGMPKIDKEKLHVTFLKEAPQKPDISYFEEVKDAEELLRIKGKEVFLYCPNGYGRSKLTNQAFEKKLSTVATTRNWKTVNALAEMVKTIHAGRMN